MIVNRWVEGDRNYLQLESGLILGWGGKEGFTIRESNTPCATELYLNTSALEELHTGLGVILRDLVGSVSRRLERGGGCCG